MTEKSITKGLSSNTLKIIGAVTMVIDHIGYILLPNLVIFRIIGRISFPIFSYLICEGCRYTKNKKKYLLRMLILGVVTSAAYIIVNREIYLSVPITFSLSILLIFTLQNIKNGQELKDKLLHLGVFAFLLFAVFVLSRFISVDYGFTGVVLPLFPTFVNMLDNSKSNKILLFKKEFAGFCVGLLAICVLSRGIQVFSLISLIFLAFYNGEKGIKLPKYFFYIFYPAHLVILWGIAMIISLIK